MPNEQILQWIWNIGGPFIPICAIVWAFYTNRIYTRKSVEDIVAAKDKTISEQNEKLQEYWEMFKTGIIVAERALDKREAEDRVRRR